VSVGGVVVAGRANHEAAALVPVQLDLQQRRVDLLLSCLQNNSQW
jgi:hypothetical protein